jgi:hypothetical protein
LNSSLFAGKRNERKGRKEKRKGKKGNNRVTQGRAHALRDGALARRAMFVSLILLHLPNETRSLAAK